MLVSGLVKCEDFGSGDTILSITMVSPVYIVKCGIVVFVAGSFCWKLACYFIWPFGKYLYKVSNYSIL